VHPRALITLALATIVLVVRVATLYAGLGPHVSIVPSGWNVTAAADGGVEVVGLGERDSTGRPSPSFAAGLRTSDRIVDIVTADGVSHPIRSITEFREARRALRRGAAWTMAVERGPERAPLRLDMPIVPVDALPGDYPSEFQLAWFTFIIPLAAIATACLLGFGKPTSDQAFVGALMFLAFACFWETFPNYMPSGLRLLTVASRSIGLTLLFYLVMHFFFIFPTRSVIDLRLPWLRRSLLALLLALATARLGRDLLRDVSPAIADTFRGIAASLGGVELLSLGALPLGIVAMVINLRRAETADARRRLVILVVVVAAYFFGVMTEWLRRVWPGVFQPGWTSVVYGAVGLLFPASFGYVVLKDRVFGISLIIRRGLQYALVSRGVQMVEAVLFFGALLFLASRVFPDARVASASPVLVTATALAGIAGAAGVARLNSRMMAALDRRFFREQYDAARILTALAQDVRQLVARPRELIETATRSISASLHVTRVTVLALDRNSETYSVSRSSGQVVDEHIPAAQDVGLRLKALADGATAPIDVRAADAPQIAGFTPALLVPLAVDRRPFGFIALGEKLSEEPYSSEDKQLLQSVGDQLGIALGYAELIAQVVEQEKLRHDVALAREVQEHLFPQYVPPLRTLDYGADCKPARSVGGDYYDFLPLSASEVGLAVGDISGKGVSASLLMASLQALLRSRATLRSRDVGGLVADLNSLLFESTAANKYATFFYGVYDDAARTLTYVNAGHVAPLVVSASEAAPRRLEVGGPVIGMFPDLRYESATVALQPGDLLLVCTDGIAEAMNIDNEELGDARLETLARSCLGLTASEARTRILAGVEAFVADAPQHDDLTLVVAVARP
jgi:phosphoserine phosphatase RsbU/P